MTLGEQIRQGREERNFSQEELAGQLGVSRQAVSKWESDLSVPAGANRRALCRLLSLELPDVAPPAGSPRQRFLCAAGWAAAALLLAALVCSLLWPGRPSGQDPAEPAPALRGVQFFDGRQEEVLPEALWYNAAGMESVLLQWTGPSPTAVRMLWTPAGAETMEETKLLATKTVADGENVLLLSAEPLRGEGQSGHLHFELDYGDHVVPSEEFNVLFDETLLAR